MASFAGGVVGMVQSYVMNDGKQVNNREICTILDFQYGYIFLIDFLNVVRASKQFLPRGS